MTLILRTVVVVVAILVVSTTATPPPGYIKKPDNDEHPPSYQYKYDIQDDVGERHGKTESREGEHASGRYYVNSKRSSTDVKYFADEWGYHPLVKYDSSDEHSRASASFAIGEKAVQNLHDESIGQSTSGFSVTGGGEKIVRIIQPYLTAQQVVGENGISSSSSSESAVFSANFNDSELSQQSLSSFGPASSFSANYVTDQPQQGLVKIIPSPENEIFQSTIIREQSELASSNDLTPTSPDEAQLIVENAGSFGQRLQVQGDDASVYSTSASTASSISVQNEILGSTRDSRNFRGRTRQKGGKAYLPEATPGFRDYSSTSAPALDITGTANSIEIESVSAQGHENNGILEAHSGAGVSVTTPNSFLINYASQAMFSSDSRAAVDVTLSDKKDYVFSKPIVVPDVPKETPFQYSTTFKCEDDEALPSTANPLASIQDGLDDTTSSHVLNPIQAGVALVNAGEAHLIGSGDNLDEKLPAPVNEKVEDIPQADQPVGQLSNTIATQDNNYVGVNPAFGGQQDAAQQKSPAEQVVEVQRSLEVYQSLAKQKPQSSEQSTNSQATDNNQQQTHETQQQQQLSTTSEFNSTGNSQSRSETLTTVYEINDNYPKDSIDNRQIYVVPPATYILEDSSILKNSLLQEKVQQYAAHGSNARIETQSGIIYDKEPVYEQPQSAGAVEPSSGPIIEKAIHLSQVYPVEKIIEKKIPYTIEKVIEKKIPIPQPYPVPVEVPIPHPLPIPVEKVVEKKIPVPVHIPIPHPYPVEKPIHIPIPIEKIVEKPIHIPIPQPYPVKVEKIIERKIPYPVEVPKYIEKPITIPAPYGVQYGVSYQQIMQPQNHGLYSVQSNKLSPLYALSLSTNNLYNNYGNKNINDASVNNLTHSQAFQGYVYDKPAIPFNEEKQSIDNNQLLNSKTAGKKFSYNPYAPTSYLLSNSLLHRRHTAVHRPSKFERNDYFGPVPPLLHVQRQYGFQTKSFGPYLSIDRTQNSRQGRNHEPVRYQKGNFRQSKIEYGFKPPMVPSVQYDEETASKVES